MDGFIEKRRAESQLSALWSLHLPNQLVVLVPASPECKKQKVKTKNGMLTSATRGGVAHERAAAVRV